MPRRNGELLLGRKQVQIERNKDCISRARCNACVYPPDSPIFSLGRSIFLTPFNDLRLYAYSFPRVLRTTSRYHHPYWRDTYSIVSGGVCHIDSSFLRVDQDTMKLIYTIFVLGAVAFAAPSVQDADTDTDNPCHFTPCSDFPMCKPGEIEIASESCSGTYLAKALCCVEP
jgi:hypothetical protein